MYILKRSNQNFFTKWWYSIDRLTLFIVLILVLVGAMSCATASPIVSKKIGLNHSHMIKRHVVNMSITLCFAVMFSFFDKKRIYKINLISFFIFIFPMVVVLFFGDEIKGSKRWLRLLGYSIQPSEFIKYYLIIVNSALLSKIDKDKLQQEIRSNYLISIFFTSVVVFLTLLQPDIGMSLVILITWSTQLFLTISNVIYCSYLIAFFTTLGIASYLFFDHVKNRVDSFLGLASSNIDRYQVSQSLSAFKSGGFFGKGPGQGTIKNAIPDVHSDFIISAIAEEFGLISCIMIACLYMTIFFRSISRAVKTYDKFILLSCVGILMQMQIQVIINFFVNADLMPTKGMTLPLISYGGSSNISFGIALGMVLSLTKISHIKNKF